MDLKTLVMLVLMASVMLTVVALALEAAPADLTSVLRRPGLLLRSFVAMNVVMPLAAVALALAFDLHPAIKIALVALALSPIPPLLPKTQLKAGGDSSFIYGLLVASGLIAVVFIPLALEVIERIFGFALELSAGRIAKTVALTILAPMCVGLLVKKMAPAFAARIAKPLMLVATVLLALGALAILASVGSAIMSLLGNGTVIAFIVFIALGLAVGHLMGGPAPGDRTVLAFANASRHPGIALAIASANFPDEKLVLPAVMLFLITSTVLTIPYTRWRRASSLTDVAIGR